MDADTNSAFLFCTQTTTFFRSSRALLSPERRVLLEVVVVEVRAPLVVSLRPQYTLRFSRSNASQRSLLNGCVRLIETIVGGTGCESQPRDYVTSQEGIVIR